MLQNKIKMSAPSHLKCTIFLWEMWKAWITASLIKKHWNNYYYYDYEYNDTLLSQIQRIFFIYILIRITLITTNFMYLIYNIYNISIMSKMIALSSIISENTISCQVKFKEYFYNYIN